MHLIAGAQQHRKVKIMSDLIDKFEDFATPKREEIHNKKHESNGNGTNNGDTKATREPARYWLNVGIVRGDKLLTLPMGIALDKLKAKNIPQKASDFQALRIEEGKLWGQFKEFYQELKPGESKRVNFVCEIRMTSEAEQIEETENPYLLGKLSFT